MSSQPMWSVVAGTGHRPEHLTPSERAWARAELPRVVGKLRLEYGIAVGRSGMARGFDLWWADALVDCFVSLSAHVPYPQQPERWRSEDRSEWQRLLTAASEVVEYGDHYDVRLLHIRNAGMLRGANAVVTLYKPSRPEGGTHSTISKAVALGLPFIHLNPDKWTVSLTTDPRRAA